MHREDDRDTVFVNALVHEAFEFRMVRVVNRHEALLRFGLRERSSQEPIAHGGRVPKESVRQRNIGPRAFNGLAVILVAASVQVDDVTRHMGSKESGSSRRSICHELVDERVRVTEHVTRVRVEGHVPRCGHVETGVRNLNHDGRCGARGGIEAVRAYAHTLDVAQLDASARAPRARLTQEGSVRMRTISHPCAFSLKS